MLGLSLVAASGGHSSSRCAGLSLSWPLLLRSTGSRRAGSAVVAHGPSCSAACGISPDQGSNPCPLHWQADSQPLRHQGSPVLFIFILQQNEFYFFDLEIWGMTLTIGIYVGPLVMCLYFVEHRADVHEVHVSWTHMMDNICHSFRKHLPAIYSCQALPHTLGIQR